MTTLHLQSSRRLTYHKTRKGELKSLNWPHALTPKSITIHPEKLSQAGFISTPTATAPDLVTCYLCQTTVQDWTVGDLPLERHREANPYCAYVKMQSVVWDEWRTEAEWDWGDDGEDWPRSEKMDQARLDTFAIGWPHAGVTGIPTPDEIGAAGMFFRATAAEDEADNCVCPYCARAVSSWEAGDDPLALHRRKAGVNCPFFIAPDPRTSVPVAAATKKVKKSSEGLTRSKGRKQLAAVEPTIEAIPEPEPELEAIVEDLLPVEVVPERVVKKPSRSRSTKGVQSITPLIEEELAHHLPPLAFGSIVEPEPFFALSEAVLEPVIDEEPIAAPKSHASSAKNKSKAKGKDSSIIAPEPVDEPESIIAEQEEQTVEAPVAVAVSSLKSKGKGKSKKESTIVVEPTVEAEVAMEEELEVAVVAAVSSAKSKSKSKAKKDPQIDFAPIIEVEIAVDEIEPVVAASLTKSKRKSKLKKDSTIVESTIKLDIGLEQEEHVPEISQVDVVEKVLEETITPGVAPSSELVEAPLPAQVHIMELESIAIIEQIVKEKKTKKKGTTKSKKAVAASAIVNTSAVDPVMASASTYTVPMPCTPPPAPQVIASPFPEFIPRPNPFAIETDLAPPTEAEMNNLTLVQWYQLCGNKMVDKFENESAREEEDFAIKIASAVGRLRGMIDRAAAKEGKRGKRA